VAVATFSVQPNFFRFLGREAFQRRPNSTNAG
jgi:hypothetical protein